MKQVDSLTKDIIGNGVVVVDFYADWCTPCKYLTPIFERLSNNTPNASFYKVNADNAYMTTQEYNINSLPTVLIFRDGELVDKIVGMVKEETLNERVRNALSKVQS